MNQLGKKYPKILKSYIKETTFLLAYNHDDLFHQIFEEIADSKLSFPPKDRIKE